MRYDDGAPGPQKYVMKVLHIICIYMYIFSRFNLCIYAKSIMQCVVKCTYNRNINATIGVRHSDMTVV